MGGPKHVFRWDLDKSYLRTEFDSFRDLVKSAIETAADKQAYPGATSLLRALGASDEHRICIVSGSPSQMRSVLAVAVAAILDGADVKASLDDAAEQANNLIADYNARNS